MRPVLVDHDLIILRSRARTAWWNFDQSCLSGFEGVRRFPMTSLLDRHVYTPYERLIYKNAMVFHINFDGHQFEKNKAFVTTDLHVISNGREFRGADEYVKSIARLVGPFPDVRITDMSTLVDGNMAAVQFVITGTHKGDFETPEGVLHATNRAVKIDGIEYRTFNRGGKAYRSIDCRGCGRLVATAQGEEYELVRL